MTDIGPSNEDIAQILEELALYVELEGENPFKSRAFKNAAQTIRGIDVSLSQMIRQDKDLKQFTGIGKNIENKIKEIIQTGSLNKLQKLRRKYPEGILDIIKIPGIGPKQAIELCRKYGLKTQEDIYKFAKTGQLRLLRGFGEKKEQKVISFLDKLLSQKKSFKLPEVEPFVKQFINYLKEVKRIGDPFVVGSFRRKKDIIRNIDMLFKGSLEEVVPILKDYALQKNGGVIIRSQDKVEIEIKKKPNITIRLIEPSQFGIKTIFFTGSKKFNKELWEFSKEKLNIGNLWDDSIVLNLTEQEIFQKLDIEFISPELREGRGEIERGVKKCLPKLVEESDILGDLHIHTNYTDGRNTIQEYAQSAILKGYEYICITDHSKRLRMVNGLDEKAIRRQIEEIESINQDIQGIEILKGIEVDILEDGSLDLPNSILKDLDIVIASVHSKFQLPKRSQTKRIIRAMKNPYVNIIGHPTGRLIGRREPYAIDMDEVINCALETGCILELNSQPDRLDLNDYYLKLAKDAGVKICINSDAHDIHGLGLIKYGIYQARRGWLEKEDIINTLSKEEILKIISNKRV